MRHNLAQHSPWLRLLAAAGLIYYVGDWVEGVLDSEASLLEKIGACASFLSFVYLNYYFGFFDGVLILLRALAGILLYLGRTMVGAGRRILELVVKGERVLIGEGPVGPIPKPDTAPVAGRPDWPRTVASACALFAVVAMASLALGLARREAPHPPERVVLPLPKPPPFKNAPSLDPDPFDERWIMPGAPKNIGDNDWVPLPRPDPRRLKPMRRR